MAKPDKKELPRRAKAVSYAMDVLDRLGREKVDQGSVSGEDAIGKMRDLLRDAWLNGYRHGQAAGEDDDHLDRFCFCGHRRGAHVGSPEAWERRCLEADCGCGEFKEEGGG